MVDERPEADTQLSRGIVRIHGIACPREREDGQRQAAGRETPCASTVCAEGGSDRMVCVRCVLLQSTHSNHHHHHHIIE